MKALFQSAINLIKGFFQQWNKPGEGKYISSKELVAYSVGGMGVQFIVAIQGFITLSASCLLLGSVYQIKPTAFATILLVNTIATLVLTPFKSWLIDKVRTKNGKIKPWILWLAFPTAILEIIFAFIPYNNMSNNQVTVVVGVIYVVMSFIYNFYLGMYSQLPQLMTPNTDERAVVYSFSSIVYSMAPTITGALFPLLATFFDKGLFDINYYRILFPITAILGAVLSLWVYFGTKERVIVPQTYKAKVKFWETMKEICSCKYVWVLNLASVSVFARGAMVGVITWMYTYMLQNNVIYSLLTLIIGTASFFGMLLAPILSKKIGKRNTTMMSDFVVMAASFILIFFNNSVAIMSICLYLSYFGMAIQIITLPAFNGDMLDYLQWKTGKRLEGMTGNISVITSLIAIGTNYVIPYINEYFGLIDNYDVLYDASVRTPMFRVLAILATIGALVHGLTYLPWDLTEKKHAEIIEELKQRAILENQEAGYEDASILSSNEKLESAELNVELLNEAEKDLKDEGSIIVDNGGNE